MSILNRSSVARLAFIAVFAAGLGAASVAHAAETRSAEVPVSAQARADARALAHIILVGIGFKALMLHAMEPQSEDLAPKSRPEWVKLSQDAYAAILDEKMPLIESMAGDRLAQVMPPDELYAGLAFMRSAAGQAMISGGGPSSLTPEQRADRDRFLATKAGAGFMEHLSHIGEILEPVGDDLVVALYPAYMRRLGERAEAGEAAHPRAPVSTVVGPAADTAHALYDASGFRELLVMKAIASFPDIARRPQWRSMMLEAFVETLDAKRPETEAMMASHFARDLSPQALADGAEFMRTPVGMFVMKQAVDRVAGQPSRSNVPAVQKMVDDFGSTPDGRAFVAELEKADRALFSSTDDLVPRVYPGAFRRFGEQAEAAEAGHAH